MFSWDKSQGNIIFKQHHFSAQVQDVLPAVVIESHLPKFVFKLSFFLVHRPPWLWASWMSWLGEVQGVCGPCWHSPGAPTSSKIFQRISLGLQSPSNSGCHKEALWRSWQGGAACQQEGHTRPYFLWECLATGAKHKKFEVISNPTRALNAFPDLVLRLWQLQWKIHLLLLWGENPTHTSWHQSILTTLQDHTFQWRRKASGINSLDGSRTWR